MARKQFTEIINEATSDEDDLPYMDSGSTSLASVYEGMPFNDTTESLDHPSTLYGSACFQDLYHTHIGEGTTTAVTGGVHMNHSNISSPRASSTSTLLYRNCLFCDTPS